MKIAFSAFLVLASLNLYAQSEPIVITSPIDHVFVPMGFDNNDNIEVVVTGKFPNPCYIKNSMHVRVQDEKIHIEVTALKKDNPDLAMCAPMEVPFRESITIGNLQGGDYDLIINEGTRFEHNEKLQVAVSDSQSVDDYLYPIVEYVELGFTGGLSGDAFIIARSPSDCVVFDQVKYISNGKDTISVLPIMKKVTGVCNNRQKRIEIPIKFKPNAFRNKDVLLFVRSIEGKAVNTIISKD